MKIELPQVGESVTEGIIGKWLKQVGDRVEKYDPLVEVVTDKVSMEIPSPVSGTLAAILAREGQSVPMGMFIAEIDTGEVDVSVAECTMEFEAVGDVSDRTGTLLKDVQPVGPTGSGGLVLSDGDRSSELPAKDSPAVLRLAAEHQVDLSLIRGTGRGGRVTRKDLQDYLLSVNDPVEVVLQEDEMLDSEGEDEYVPLAPVRRTIADRMVRSATEIPEAWMMVEADVTTLVHLREMVKSDFKRREGIRLTYLPFVLKSVADCLKDHPLVNSTWGEDAIILKRQINIGIATATADGLMVPVLRNADAYLIGDLAKMADDLAARARRQSLVVDDVQGGTFTVNNTGTLGSVAGKAMINYPQAAILNTEAIIKRPVVVSDAITVRSMMNLCLTFDHRIIDGAEAGAFLAGVKKRLENFSQAQKV